MRTFQYWKSNTLHIGRKGQKGLYRHNRASLIQNLWRRKMACKVVAWKRKLIENTIVHGSCIEGMRHLPDACADIVICDPPYNIGKDFGNDSDKQEMNEYLHFCDLWIQEALRILKPEGTLYIYGYSEILAHIHVQMEHSCHIRWLIWHYTNKNCPSAKFWGRSHESILCCSKVPRPRFNLDDVREPYTEGFVQGAAGKTRKATKGRFSKGDQETTYTAHPNGAMPRDVIKLPTLAGGGKERVKGHPTQKPLALCNKLLKAALNKAGETFVVVPFAGSGSECVSAKQLGLRFLGFELNEDYITLAHTRLEGSPT